MPVTVAKSALAKTNVRYKPRKGRKDFTKNLLGCDLGCDLRCDLRRGDVPTGIAGARRGRVNAALNFHKHRVTRSPCRLRNWRGSRNQAPCRAWQSCIITPLTARDAMLPLPTCYTPPPPLLATSQEGNSL